MRYKVGWFIPQQVLALTHLASEVTQDEFIEIVGTANACLREVQQPFHLIIDNRNIKSEQVVSLDIILQSMPQLQAQPPRWIVMVLPYIVQQRAEARATQQVGAVQLKYVDTLAAGLDVLRTMDASLNWELQVSDFFADDVTHNL